MQVERFQAKTMKEALDQVKRELGEDAVILSTRTVRSRGKGLLSQRLFEISALPWDPARKALEGPPPVAVAPLVPPAPPPPLVEPGLTRADLDQALDAIRQDMRALKAQMRHNSDPLRRDLRKTVQELRTAMALVMDRPDDPVAQVRKQLEGSGVGPVLAAAVIEEARRAMGDEELDDAQTKAMLTARAEQVIARRLAARPGLPKGTAAGRVMALVGPTGVGKTTTAAKLASLGALVEGREVLLVTMDTYRVGAVEQLRRYAALIGVPLAVVGDGKSLCSALASHPSADLVLIDTAGRSPRHPEPFDALTGALAQAGEPVEVQLLLPAAARLVELEATLKQYECLRPERLLITKVDEALGGGAVLEACVRTNLPVSYVCNGQRVPEDIFPSNPAWLAAFVLGQEEN
jgi:flagellar biosynthesis protein FlhF